MRFRDLLDPERAPAFLMKLAVSMIVLSILLQCVVCSLRQISQAAVFEMLCFFLLLSPVAYLIRKWRQGGKQRPARRGEERTPLLPQNEEVE